MGTQESKHSGLLPVVFVAAITIVTLLFVACGQTLPPTISVAMLTLPNPNNACAQVTMGDTNANAQIFFTLDGTTPKPSAGGSTQVYNGPFTLSLNAMTSNTGTVKAIAVASGYTPSGTASQAFVCPIPEPSFVIVSGGCPVDVADIKNPMPGQTRSLGTSIYYEIGGNGNPSNLSTWLDWTRAFEVYGTTTIYALAAMGPSPQNWSPIVSYPVNCAPPPAGRYDFVSIVMSTGGDDARRDDEVWATMSGQSGNSLCLKASDNAPPSAACAKNGPALDFTTYLGTYLPEWPNGTTDTPGTVFPNDNHQFISGTTNNFRLASPQASIAGFGTMDIMLVQHPRWPETPDNWNIQGIKVVVWDSNNAFPPHTLLQISNPGTGSNCLARLKGPPDATTVRFSLNGSADPVYVDGNAAGVTATCLNNGG